MNPPANLSEKQAAFIARYSIIEDPHERLAAIVARGKKWPAPGEEDRIDAHRVQGCVSQVWLTGSVEKGHSRFRMAADSPLVQGLAALLCELYDGETAPEILAVEPELFEALGLTRQISPTRLNGLANVRRVIRDFAAQQLA